ncbi:MAG TPA: nitroreductase family protein [Candidatus Pullilachnospira intestinigallinarum]|nr:nitroreductase family protein [Candidatus Pullilachnospira intestinigallinarum]
MNLYEAIFVRRSVKNYLPESLSPQMLQDILNEYDEVKGLFGGIETELVILDNRKGEYHLLGLFGIRAPYYLAIYSEEKDRALMNAGYLMQQMSLYLCTRGLGSCFVGNPMMKKKYTRRDGKKLMTVLAFGKPRGSCTRKPVEARRLSLAELCVYKEMPRQWMKQLLEAARMAPSSMNSQPWRFVVFDSRIHIFSKKHASDRLGKFDELNFGIMFANMMVAAEELWLDVDLIRLEEISQKNFPNSQYMLSAILRP